MTNNPAQLSYFKMQLMYPVDATGSKICRGLKRKYAIGLIALLYCCVSVFVLPSSAMAQSAEEASDDFDVQKLEESWSPGERYSGLKGVMDYAHTDVYLPGNGNLPIEITRRFNQPKVTGIYSAAGTFGLMHMATPRIWYTNDSGEEVTITCSKSGDTSSTNSLIVPITFLHGETETIFFGGENNSGEFRSPDGWRLSCVRNDNMFAESTGHGNMVVHSPEGITYEMDSNTVLPSVNSSLRVARIIDQYGNTLTYNYHDPSDVYGKRNRLDSIVASDGREVTIGYKRVSLRNGRNQLVEVDRVDTITSNSRDNPVNLKYSYEGKAGMTVTESGVDTTSIRYSEGRISSITYPTGGTVNYTYSGKWSTANVSYDQLSERTTSDGSVFRFSQSDNGDATFTRTIRTPSALLEYQYGKATALRRNRSQNYTINSGRLMKSSRSTLGHRRLLDVDYTYKTLYSVSSLVRQDSDFVVPETTTYGMNFDFGSTTANSVFTTNYVQYDDFGYLTSMDELSPGGGTISTSYTYRHDDFNKYIVGKLASEQTLGDTQSYEYNQSGDVVRHSDNGVVTTYQWYDRGSAGGELNSVTTGRGNTTIYQHYKRGQAQYTRNPSNFGKVSSINDNGSIASESRYTANLNYDSSHRPVTAYQYDSLRRLIFTDPLRSQSAGTRQTWQNSNNVTTTDEGYERFESFERLDGFGRTILKATRDKDQNRWSSIRYRYDNEGRLVYESFPENKSVNEMMGSNSTIGIAYQYDSLDRLTKVTRTEASNDQSVIEYQYGGGSGNRLVIDQIDGRGSKTSTTYTSYGIPHYQLPTTIKEADGTATVLTRSPNTGRVLNLSRAGETKTYEYNSQGQVSSITQSENGETTFTYYADGLLKTRNNRGRSIFYEYFDDGRVKKEHFTDSAASNVTREFTYDSYMNLASLITRSDDGTQSNTLNYTYDADGNVTSQELLVDGSSYRIQYGYDELSNLSSITYPNNRVYDYRPNSFGRPTHIGQQGGKAKIIYDSITYNNNNSMKEMTRNGGHQIRNLLSAGQRPQAYRVAQYGDNRTAALKESVYAYDKANNVSRINDAVNGQYSTFAYDSKNRLTVANVGGANNWEFTYLSTDDISTMKVNGAVSKYAYASDSRQLMSIASNVVRSFEHDQHGNMQRHERLTDSQTVSRLNLTYNAANQLVESSDGTRYEYDGRGLRVKKELGGAIYTLYDKDQKLIYRDDAGTGVTSEYFYVDGKLVARRDEDVGGSASSADAPAEEADVLNGITEESTVEAGESVVVDVLFDDGSVVVVETEESSDDTSEPIAGEPADDVVVPDEELVVEVIEQLVEYLDVATPKVPSTLTPTGSNAGSKPEYKWSAVPEAVDYDIEVRKSDAEEVLVFQTYDEVIAGCPGGSGECEVGSPHGNDLSGDYRWRVRSRDGAHESQWSEWRLFSVGN